MHDIPTIRDVSAFTMVRNLITGSRIAFRFARRPASLPKQAGADHGVAHATENVVGCVNDEASTERGMEHVGEAQLAQGHGEATAGSVIGCLGEEATSDGRVKRGGGGNEGLGEGGEEERLVPEIICNCYWYLLAYELPASSFSYAEP